ncbi:hypothetical protein [Sphingomonas sp.]|uniref:hypothetical protein n=1 Tax=Sphingomonas sp. TaxID=28214 RepID=UPI001B13584E|nr:hypothetical protein [Sphingomonas sp.]MBO9714628.1 hypothetical protein [Sphingomonas sp.]
MFVNAMQNNTVLQYFKDRSDAMTATHDWEDISDMFDNGPKVEELLQTSTRMVFENTTVYVAPIGENLATAMDGDMASLQSGLAGEAETGTMSEALDKVVAELVAV